MTNCIIVIPFLDKAKEKKKRVTNYTVIQIKIVATLM